LNKIKEEISEDYKVKSSIKEQIFDNSDSASNADEQQEAFNSYFKKSAEDRGKQKYFDMQLNDAKAALRGTIAESEKLKNESRYNQS
jgi:hypothetical protein